MLNFNLGALAEWEQVAVGEVLLLDVGTAGHRRVEFEVFADSRVALVANVGGQDWPVAVGEGWMAVSFGTSEPVQLHLFGEPEALVRLRTRSRTQVVPASEEPSYATIEPRPSGPSDEVRRMMRVMHLNHERRMAELRAEVMAARSEQEAMAAVIEEMGAAASAPAPAPAPAPDPVEGKA